MFNFEVYTEGTVLTATSYITVDELDLIINKDYLVNSISLLAETTENKENILVNATRILDNLFEYEGHKQYYLQNLQFPRSFEDETELYIINDNVKIATAYIACELKNGTISTIINTSTKAQVQSEKADVLEKSYFENKIKERNIFVNHPYLKTLLSGYIEGSGVSSIGIYRG